MSLLKLPFLLSIIWSTYITFTPPHPALQPDQVIPQSRLPLLVAPAIKAIFIASLVVEMTTILAASFSYSMLSSLSPNYAGLPQVAPLFLLGWIVNLSGGLIRKSCYRTLGHFFTFEVGVQRDQKLVTTGPYSIVRHPSYTGAAMTAAGALWVIMTDFVRCTLVPESYVLWGSVWGAAGLCGLLVIIPRLTEEDEMLRRKFGAEWERWRESVPYRLIPWIL